VFTARVAVVSDTHLSGRAPDALHNWDAVVREIERTGPDLVVHLGDLTLDGTDNRQDLEDARAALDRLTVPWRAVPGNHDIGDWLPRRPTGLFLLPPGPDCFHSSGSEWCPWS
jgi:3',5'-cyclic AMP phosphodiesterase CpdA